MADEVLFDVSDDGVAVITLNRPGKLNIFNLAMRDALIEAIQAARDHPDARSVLLRAAGPHFSAGADLSEFGTADHLLDARRIRWDRDPWGLLWELPQPTVAALHGFVLGSGLEMTLLCDLRIAATDTTVGLPETRLAMLPAAGGTQSLTRAIGPATALPFIVTAQNVTAAQALRLGLIHAVVEDVEAEALAWARRLATIPSHLAGATRRALHAAGDLPLIEGLAVEKGLARMHSVGAVTPDTATF